MAASSRCRARTAYRVRALRVLLVLGHAFANCVAGDLHRLSVAQALLEARKHYFAGDRVDSTCVNVVDPTLNFVFPLIAKIISLQRT